LGGAIGYANCLLIEDGETKPALFQALGIYACRYFNDELILDWLEAVHWSDQP